VRRTILIALTLLALLPAGARAADGLGPRTRLPDLEHPRDHRTLFARFNAAQGVPRLVLLVSPT